MDFEFKKRYDINDMLKIMAILRSENGCPWDKEQDHHSIRKDFIEEVYEAVEAIDLEDTELLREELGDVLLQVVFHSRIEEEYHGRKNQIEGRLEKGEKVVVIEDLISTGGSVLDCVEPLREAGAEVLGIVSIFTYGMQKGIDRLNAANVVNTSLCDLDTLVKVAVEENYIKPEDEAKLLKFRDNPSDESWMTHQA